MCLGVFASRLKMLESRVKVQGLDDCQDVQVLVFHYEIIAIKR